MSQLFTWFDTGWVGDMAPGARQGWIAFGGGLQAGDVIEIMAHPVVGNPNAQERILQVENVQAEGTSDGGRRVFFDVHNVGHEWIVGYRMTGMMLRA